VSKQARDRERGGRGGRVQFRQQQGVGILILGEFNSDNNKG